MELEEELGLKLPIGKFKFLDRIIKNESLFDVWIAYAGFVITDLTLQKGEVSEVKWATKQEILKMVKLETFYNYGDEYFCQIFAE
jgi:isopentenyl-diphosphate Delta-isomerase